MSEQQNPDVPISGETYTPDISKVVDELCAKIPGINNIAMICNQEIHTSALYRYGDTNSVEIQDPSVQTVPINFSWKTVHNLQERMIRLAYTMQTKISRPGSHFSVETGLSDDHELAIRVTIPRKGKLHSFTFTADENSFIEEITIAGKVISKKQYTLESARDCSYLASFQTGLNLANRLVDMVVNVDMTQIFFVISPQN